MSIWSDIEDRNAGETGKENEEQTKIVAKKIKLFHETVKEHELQEDVNSFLEELSRANKKVVDIRYSSFSNDRVVYWTVMVIYES